MNQKTSTRIQLHRNCRITSEVAYECCFFKIMLCTFFFLGGGTDLKIHLEIAAFDYLVESTVISDSDELTPFGHETIWCCNLFQTPLVDWFLKNIFLHLFLRSKSVFSFSLGEFSQPHLRYLWCPSGGQEDQYFCHSCQALGAHFNFFQMTLLTLFATGNCNNLKPMGSPGFLLEGMKVVRLIRLRSLRLMVAREPGPLGTGGRSFLQNFQDFFPEVSLKLTALSLEILNFEKGEVWGASKSVARKSFLLKISKKRLFKLSGVRNKGRSLRSYHLQSTCLNMAASLVFLYPWCSFWGLQFKAFPSTETNS